MLPPEAVPPDDVPRKDPVLASPGWVRALLRPSARRLTELQNADAGPRTYDRYGLRVPAVIVSPYAKPGYVTSTVYDHTSILKLVQQKWNLPALTRRDAGGHLPAGRGSTSTPSPRSCKPPDLPAPSLEWGHWPAERAPTSRFARVRARAIARSGSRSSRATAGHGRKSG